MYEPWKVTEVLGNKIAITIYCSSLWPNNQPLHYFAKCFLFITYLHRIR